MRKELDSVGSFIELFLTVLVAGAMVLAFGFGYPIKLYVEITDATPEVEKALLGFMYIVSCIIALLAILHHNNKLPKATKQ
jgi:hypothetical protein